MSCVLHRGKLHGFLRLYMQVTVLGCSCQDNNKPSAPGFCTLYVCSLSVPSEINKFQIELNYTDIRFLSLLLKVYHRKGY